MKRYLKKRLKSYLSAVKETGILYGIPVWNSDNECIALIIKDKNGR